MIKHWRMILALAAMQPASVVRSEQTPVVLLKGDEAALKAAVHDLCDRRVALLGEAPTHGDGHTAAFKVALAEQLITRCHYNSVIFESGRYEFIAFDRALRNKTATPTMISDAVGGLWKFDREFQPFVDFLYDRAKIGSIQIGGMDSQIGGLEEHFTNEKMVPELTQGLSQKEADSCKAAFAQHVAWTYPHDHPYLQVDHDQLLTCAADMRRVVDVDANVTRETRAERDIMIDNIVWAVDTDLSSRANQISARERWMYNNVVSIISTRPADSKVIVWGATVHLAKDASAVPMSPEKYHTLGNLLHERYGTTAFTLGFSAGSGSYRVFRKTLPIDQPPPASLEDQTLGSGKSTSVYLNKRSLARLGVVPGGALEHVYRPANWADVVDGMVVFREEWPTHSTRPGYS